MWISFFSAIVLLDVGFFLSVPFILLFTRPPAITFSHQTNLDADSIDHSGPCQRIYDQPSRIIGLLFFSFDKPFAPGPLLAAGWLPVLAHGELGQNFRSTDEFLSTVRFYLFFFLFLFDRFPQPTHKGWKQLEKKVSDKIGNTRLAKHTSRSTVYP